jgi:hypothetical protein
MINRLNWREVNCFEGKRSIRLILLSWIVFSKCICSLFLCRSQQKNQILLWESAYFCYDDLILKCLLHWFRTIRQMVNWSQCCSLHEDEIKAIKSHGLKNSLFWLLSLFHQPRSLKNEAHSSYRKDDCNCSKW